MSYMFVFGPNPRVYAPKGKDLFEISNETIERTITGDTVTYHISANIRFNAVGVEDITAVKLESDNGDELPERSGKRDV